MRNVPFLVLDLGLDVIDGVRRLHLKGDSLAGECLYKDLHSAEKRNVERCGTQRLRFDLRLGIVAVRKVVVVVVGEQRAKATWNCAYQAPS